MTHHQKNLYEGMYIISAKLSEDARQKALDKIVHGITHHGGEIHKVHDRDRRRLAYPVAGQREGHYYVVHFSVAPSVIRELWQEYHLHEDLLRFVTLRVDAVQEEIAFEPLADINS